MMRAENTRSFFAKAGGGVMVLTVVPRTKAERRLN
jgi:hypothetical protein